MAILARRLGLAFALGALALSTAWAGESRVRYAEPAELTGLPTLQAGARKTTPARARLEGLGRRFELQLEPNDRVVGRLSKAERRALPAHALYRGTVAGLPGSWVRLTRLADGLHGLVYDGRELLVIAPARSIRDRLDTALAVPDGATVVYRAADAESGLGPGFCRVVAPSGHEAGASSATLDHQVVFRELATRAGAIVAALPTLELDLGLVADTQFRTHYADPTGEMLARLNNVDGIFSAQVGVKVVSGHLEVLQNDGGMTSRDAGTLLDQFDSYRAASPGLVSRGLAHLMTGRELDGSTVGIAYMGTLCWTDAASSLSQTWSDTYFSSLIAAHELGHNFGAPHDGVGACAAVPQTYLMAPTINGSSTFSQCSVQQMAEVVEQAWCLLPASVADVRAEFAAGSIVAYPTQEFDVPVDVVSSGTLTAEDVTLTVSSPGSLNILSGTVDGGTCSVAPLELRCQLGTLEAGTRRTVSVVARADVSQQTTLSARVSARTDADPANDVATLSIDVLPAADGSVELSTNVSSAYVGEAQDLFLIARNSGPQPLDNATITLQPLTGFALEVEGAPCTANFAMTVCTLGTLAAGESRRIDLRLVGQSAWRTIVEVRLQSSHDTGFGSNDIAYLQVEALPLVEWTIQAGPAPTQIMLGETITQGFTLRSAGPQPVEQASFRTSVSAGLQVIAVTSAGATCGPVNGAAQWECAYAEPVPSGATRQVDVQLKAVSGLSASISAEAFAPASEHLDPGNGFVQLQYQLRSNVDASLGVPTSVTALDHRATRVQLSVSSLGLTPAANTQLTMGLPGGVRAVATSTWQGSCTTSPAEVVCELGTLEPDTGGLVTVDLVADAVGIHDVEARLGADDDTNPVNDAGTIRLNVQPNVDIALASMPASIEVGTGSTVDVPVTVSTASQPVADAQVRFWVAAGVAAVDVAPSAGECDAVSTLFTCRLGNLPANGMATVTVRLQGGDVATMTTLDVLVSGSGDRIADNNHGAVTVKVDVRGNVTLRPATLESQARIGSNAILPRLTVQALEASDDVRVDLTLPGSFTVDSATGDGALCAVNGGQIRCTFGTLSRGESRGIDLRVRPNQAGRFRITAVASAEDDSDLADNSAEYVVDVEDDGSGPGNSGGGGGGGGGIDPATLLVMLAMAVAGVRRRALGLEFRHVTEDPRRCVRARGPRGHGHMGRR